ncbi:MAG: hypothetical protein CHACPFDD_01685 [Phycisphaerae bacterium]|nr:hypothetical protein [Phycisphaerae bacterium]
MFADTRLTRRDALRQTALAAATLAAPAAALAAPAASLLPTAAAGAFAGPQSGGERKAAFDISLAAWSVNRMFYSGRLKQIDMPELARKQCDLAGLELVNSFFPSPQYRYCQDLSKRATDHGVRILLIMCDGEGDLSAADKAQRAQAVRNHRKWVDVAAALGCHSIRCNSGGEAKNADSIKRCAEACAALVEYARADKINIIIENHGGLSADPGSMLEVIKQVNDPLFGTLPDFGNFPKEVDRYEAVRAWMPHARAVSAKCHEFDDKGEETATDYHKMMRIVVEAGYHGFVGIEYEGKSDDEIAGVLTCKRLLERCRQELG